METRQNPLEEVVPMKQRIRIAIVVTGFCGIVGQMVLLRELLIVFSGNELSVGVVLANWLILEAFGSYFVGKQAERAKNAVITYALIALGFAISLPIMIYGTRILRLILGASIGQGIGVAPMLFASFIILLPVSIFHGALFTFGCKIYSQYVGHDPKTIGRAYTYEIFGTIAGGLAWTYLFVPYLHSFSTGLILSVLNGWIALFLLIRLPKEKNHSRQIIRAFLLLLVIGATSFLLIGASDRLHINSINTQWTPQNLVHYQNSQYSNISVIEKEGQYTYFLDGIPHILSPIPDIIYVEEFVHLSFLAHPNPRKILILSGGAGGVINEALKHPTVTSIDYCELDPLLFSLLERDPTELIQKELNDDRVRVRLMDGRLFLKMTENRYDVILVGLRALSDLQSNRFFTYEFFSLAQRKLTDDGILGFGIPGSLTYLSHELRALNTSIYHTVKEVFENTRVLPGEGTNLFLASQTDQVLQLNTEIFGQRVQERKLRASILVPRHIDYKLHEGWISWFEDFIRESPQKINHDFRPIGVFHSISYWNTLYTPHIRGLFRWFEGLEVGFLILISSLCIIGILFLRLIKAPFLGSGVAFSIGTTGFSGMIFDLALIFTFQAMYGYVFGWIGLLVTFFMAGSAIGAIIMTAILPRIRNEIRVFIQIDWFIMGFAIGLPFVFLILQPHLSHPTLFQSVRWIILALSLVSGLLISAQFPLANRIMLKKKTNLSKTAGLMYGSDLMGGWIGGIIGSVILMPILGLLGTCIVVVMLKLCSLVVIITNPRT